MSGLDRPVGLVTGRSKRVIAVLAVVTLLVGAGAADLEETTEMELFAEEPPEVEAERYVQEEFTPHDGNTTRLVVVAYDESGNVLERDSLLESLRYQQSLRENDTVGPTLAAEQPSLGVENLVATAALQRERGDREGDGAPPELPPLDEQAAQLESMSDRDVEAVVGRLLDPDEPGRMTDTALEFVPGSYEPGSTEADGRVTVVTQETDGLVVSIPELSGEVRDAQVAADALASDAGEGYRLSGYGLMLVEEEESLDDSLALAGPAALLFVLLTLAVVYRDALDLALGVVGILLVLVWTFGGMGWLGIEFSLMMLATPVLLVGLSVDYCIHVVMRYRESRVDDRSVDGGEEGDEHSPDPARAAMHDALVGLGPALALVTVTAMLGFLSIRTSNVPALADFGVATAFGLLAALVVFGGLVPALKVELDGRLAVRRESRGDGRAKRAFGTTGRIRDVLAGVARVSYRRPLSVVAVVLLVSSLGAAGTTQLETNFSTDDYVAEDPPEWTRDLPEPLAPGEYEVRETRDLLYANFQSPDQQVHVVVDGDATDPAVLERVAAAERDAADRAVTAERPTGEPAVSGPVGAMHAAAGTNDTFAGLLADADTTDDGVPDEGLPAVLDAFYDAAPEQADRLLHRTNDGYEGLRLAVVVDGTADPSTVAAEMREVGDVADGEGTTVTVAGEPILNELVQRQLATTTASGLAVALATVLAVLLVAFRYRRDSATLGAVTLLPVLFGLSWVLGAMAVAGIPFSFGTAIIGSVAIGLGVDYAVHVSERFGHELDRRGDVKAALEESVVGTGGALLSSAVTTAAGFGVLALSLVPLMRQFGLLVALTLVVAFLTSVLVLPSLLVLWVRTLGDGVGGTRRSSPDR